MSRVLALRALGLGDALTAVPALRGLRRAHPAAELVLAGPAPVGQWLRGLGVVDTVVDVSGVRQLPACLGAVGAVDVAVNLHGRGPQSTALLAAAHPSMLVAFGRQAPWRADEHEVARWCRLVGTLGGRCDADDLVLADGAHDGLVICHPGAAAPSRRWPARRWRAVVEALAADGHDVLVTGSPTERALCHQVAGAAARVACSLRLTELTELVASARLVLSSDTGVAHLATACRTPSVVLFGPVAPCLWGPAIDHARHRVLFHGDPARPGDPHADQLDPALASVSADEVLHAAGPLLVGAGAR